MSEATAPPGPRHPGRAMTVLCAVFFSGGFLMAAIGPVQPELAARTGVTLAELKWLMPAIFGLGTITYWQAWGLLILGRLLIGGFRMGGHGGSPRWRRRRRERWAHMSPEERQKFRRSMWGHYAPPETPPQPGQ